MTRVRPDQRAYNQARRDAAGMRGDCIECACRPARENRRRCQMCTDRQRQRSADLVADGGCRGLCGKQALPDHSRCQPCLDKHRAYMAGRRLAAGPKPRKPRRPRAEPSSASAARFLASRAKRKQRSSTSAVPPAFRTMAPAAPPTAEVDLSTRRAVIAALAARRVA